jgi:hypothetical protein
MNYAQLFETIKGYVENDFPSGPSLRIQALGTGTYLLPKNRLTRLLSRLSKEYLTRFSFLTSEKIKQARFHLPTSI